MIHIRRMTAADMELGLRLSGQARWNQTEADWRRFLDLGGEGCFVAEMDGTAVGTTTTCIFDSVAWIAMVLVDVEKRRQGVGSALLRHALSFLDDRGVATVRLDATAAGQRVYEKLGFKPEYPLTRYEGVVSRTGSRCHTIEATATMVPKLIELDRHMTGTNRARLLARLFEDTPEAVRVLKAATKLEGFIATRPGANATQIGPCIASAQAGPILLADALSRCTGQGVFVDVPCDHVRAVTTLEASGLKAQRHFMRMVRGKPVCDHVEGLWASAGPETG
jgi:GNAT superfamily N-acetyltransferase